MATGNFFGGQFFGGGFFGAISDAPPSGGKGDNKGKKKLHLPVKPLGLLERPKKSPEGRKTPGERVSQGIELQQEIAQRLAREFTEEAPPESPPPIERMSIAEVEAEIGALLRKKLRTEEEEILLLMLICAV